MSVLSISISFKILFTFCLCMVYLYLYRNYKEKYIGLWSLSWGLFIVRLVLDLLRFNGYDNVVFLVFNQITSLLSIYFLLLGTYNFIGKKASRLWGIVAVIVTLISDIAFALNVPFAISAVPTALYFGTIDILSGILFIRNSGIKGLGKLITGYALILLGILNSMYPLIANAPRKFTAIGFFLGSILEITIIMGTLIVYFEKIRWELSTSETRYRELIENAKDIIYRYNISPTSKFDYISPAVEKVLGYIPTEFYNKPELINEVLFLEVASTGKDLINYIISNNKPVILEMKDKNGRKVLTEQHTVPIFNQEGKMIAIEGIIRDISERKKVEEEMYRLDQMRLLGETAAGIAHEIRNPMTTARGFIQLLLAKEGLNEYREYFNLIISELDRANKIISEFLTVSKEKVNTLKLQNLNNIIMTIAPLIETNAVVLLHRIKYDLGDIPDLMLDENEIKQLIINMVQNGLDSMDIEGTITLRSHYHDGDVFLAISDEGKGIDPLILNKMGTPFITSKDKGTGLGLVVCYSIAARHKASITVETGDSGTTFTIKFTSNVQGE